MPLTVGAGLGRGDVDQGEHVELVGGLDPGVGGLAEQRRRARRRRYLDRVAVLGDALERVDQRLDRHEASSGLIVLSAVAASAPRSTTIAPSSSVIELIGRSGSSVE